MKGKHVDVDNLKILMIEWITSSLPMSDQLARVINQICENVLLQPQFFGNDHETKEEMKSNAWIEILKLNTKIKVDSEPKKLYTYISMTIKNAYFQYHRTLQQRKKNAEKYNQYVRENCQRLH